MTKNVILFAVLAVFAAASSYTSGQELALKKLFIDSNVCANETDLEHVQANVVPSVMSDPKSHHDLFARLYQERCLELDPECGVKLYEVCPVKMTTEFEVPLNASLQDASCFFLFPPGALRTALKNVFSKQVKDAFSKEVTDALSKQDKVTNYEPPSYSLIKTVFSQVPEYYVPFAPLLAEFSEYYSFDFITGFKASISSAFVYPDRANYGDYMSSNLQVFVLMLFPTIPKTLSNYNLLRLLLARLDCAQPGEEALVMGCVNGVVWDMLENNRFPPRECTNLFYQDMEGVILPASGKNEYFLSKVQLIVRNNPTVLLSNLESLQLSNIKPIAPKILRPFLDGLEYKLMCGDVHVKQSLSKVDIDVFFNLIGLEKSDWRYRHYKRVFSLPSSCPEDNSYNVPFDSAAKAVSNDDAIIHPAFSFDLQALLPPLPASLSTSFHQTTHSSSILNPIKFLTCLTSSIPEDVYHSTVRRFKAGKIPLFSGKERKLVEWMLSAKGFSYEKTRTISEIFSKFQPKNYMIYPQRYLIHSVVFRQGAFRWSTTNQDLNDYILACESVARLFYPLYVEKLKTVVQHVDENGNTVSNFEELFMCPFVDKSWLLEHYGNIHVGDINDPTNIHRLHQKGNQELQIQTLINYIKDCKLFNRDLTSVVLWDQRNNLRIRVVELLVSMIQQGYQKQVILVAECFGSFKDDVLKTLGLDPSTQNTDSLMTNKREYVFKKCNEIVNITCDYTTKSEYDVLKKLLSIVPSYEAEEMIFENLPELLSNRYFAPWEGNNAVGEKIVHRLWSKCLTKDPMAANDWARNATAIFIQVSKDSKLKLIDHVMSLISCEQDLQNFFQFDYSENTKDFTYIHDLFKKKTVSIVFKRFILRCCMNLPDSMRDERVTKCLDSFCQKCEERDQQEIRRRLILTFDNSVPYGLIRKTAAQFKDAKLAMVNDILKKLDNRN